MQSRRLFLKSSALAMFGLGAAPAWLSRAVYAADAPARRRKVLVAIFQRGAVDGLNVVVPHGESVYYDMRPNIAIPRPNGTPDAAIDLDGFFGLHPSLAPLKPIFDAQHLAIIEAVGSPDPTRSHFDAQDYMESGTPGMKGTADGWMNRALSKEKEPVSPIRAIGLGSNLPRALRGRNDAVAIDNLGDFQVRDPRGSQAFESMYSARIPNLEIAKIVDRNRVVPAPQRARQVRTQPDRPNRRHGLLLLRQRTIHPAIRSAFHTRRARFHVILRIEMRPSGVGRADGFDNRKVLGIENRLQRRQRGMQTEETVEVDGGIGRAVGPRDRNIRTHVVIHALAMGNHDVESIHCAALEDRDENLPAPRGRVRRIDRTR